MKTLTFSSNAVKPPNLAVDFLFISEHIYNSQNLVFPHFSVNMTHFLRRFIARFNVTLFPNLENFFNVVMEKNSEHQLDRSCEKLRIIKNSQGGEEYPTNNQEKGV